MRVSCAVVLLLVVVVPAAASPAAGPSPVRSSVSPRAPQPEGRRFARRSHYTASCGTASGNGGVVVAGNVNVANAYEAAVLDGAANTVCDEDSTIAGGLTNLIDSGNGANALGAQFSFIGSGTNGTISGSWSFIGSGEYDTVSGSWSSIASGEYDTVTSSLGFIGAGFSNTVSGNYGAVAGGEGNNVSGIQSFIGAGEYNAASGPYALLGAGYQNVVTSSEGAVIGGEENQVTGNASFIGGGGSLYGAQTNNNPLYPNDRISGADSFIGAGDENVVNSQESFIGSGQANAISASGPFDAIGGGYSNHEAGGYDTIGGGANNQARGRFATVPGGSHNEASGTLSFAAGYQARALHDGSFVWSDDVSGAKPLSDTNANEFVVRASGGTLVYSSEDLASGVSLGAGSGTWASLSDRHAKTDIVPLDDAAVLAKVAALPLSTWRYKTESGVRHVGPMAQDFYAAFGVGEDDRHITSIDEDGVALAAIKALRAENVAEREQLAALRSEVHRLEAVVRTRASSPSP